MLFVMKELKPKVKVKLRIMKRLFLTVMAVLSMAVTFAENENLNSVDKTNIYNMTVNYSKLAESLGLTQDQLESVQDIHAEFCADMLNAYSANADERKEMVSKAINKDIRYMHYVLTREQYRKYLMILNATVNNRGLNK